MIGCIFRLLLSLFLFILLSGCTSISTVTFPDGETFVLEAKTDEFVTVTEDGKTYVFDRRGRPTLFESIITMIFTDTTMKNKVKE